MTEVNSNHERVLATGFFDIHRRLEEMEAFLARSSNSSPLSEHVHDISPTEAKVIQGYFARFGSTLMACSQENDIPLKIRHTSVRWTSQTRIEFLQIAIAELGPEPRQVAGVSQQTGPWRIADAWGRARVLEFFSKTRLSRLT